MADLYGTAPSSASQLEPEEINTFFNQFLHNSNNNNNDNNNNNNSSSSSDSCFPLQSKYVNSFPNPPPPPSSEPDSGAFPFDDQRRFSRSLKRAVSDCGVREGSSGLNFSDPGGYFVTHVKDRAENTFSSVGEFSCDSEGGDPSMEARRTSSKRSRAAEVHNLSEKRRRSRINEKMKALQNLIPNSNKTDKASMLDEAIEYLKQLQVQVQMLSMSNGLTLYPTYVPGLLPPIQLSPSGIPYHEGKGELIDDSSPPTGRLSDIQDTSIQITMETKTTTFEPLIQDSYGPYKLDQTSAPSRP